MSLLSLLLLTPVLPSLSTKHTLIQLHEKDKLALNQPSVFFAFMVAKKTGGHTRPNQDSCGSIFRQEPGFGSKVWWSSFFIT